MRGNYRPEQRLASGHRFTLYLLVVGIGPRCQRFAEWPLSISKLPGTEADALGVRIESAWTHITCNPVAVNLQCARAERRRAKISASGEVEVGF